jgi:hypothetical protein
MTDPSGSYLLSMAEEVGRAMGRFHPGRPAFSALSRAHEALKAAAQEVDYARRTYAPGRDGARDGEGSGGVR